MKIVIAPDSYKESLSAPAVADRIEAGFRAVFPCADYVKVPLADGGEGTVDALVAAARGRKVVLTVTGPLGRPVPAVYGLIDAPQPSAVIEMAAASGLALVPPSQRNPMQTTSRGTGELIRAALDAGATQFIIGIGGSATNDGGAGMVQALGARLLDQQGLPIGPGAQGLADLARIDASGLDARLARCRVEVACDVDNPLTGPQGASAIFGPQKGATPSMVEQLDVYLAHYASLIERDLGSSVAAVPGAGAAGGMGAALLAFLRARIRPGIELVMETLGLAAIVRDADLVITGEGRIDAQTVHGKTPIGVARMARRYGKPVIAIAGSLSRDAGVVSAHGIDALFAALHRIGTLEEALRQAGDNVETAARNVAAAIKTGMEMRGQADEQGRSA
ncbi:MAG: glycerate kinase [Burkholderiaceae bacterium]|jgi:glycerate kinase|nr:glycerate kinase [Burkholderiaceae bacterium]